jgi:RNA polymerase sigma-70 factor (ECF subfamily)
MEMTDDQLISSYRSGNGEDFKVLIDKYKNPIFLFALRMTGNKGDAEDVAQETFVKLWRTLERYREGANFKAWIFAIARNTAIDKLRKKKSNVFSDFDMEDGKNWITETFSDPDSIPEELIARAEQNNLLEKALAELPKPDQEILHLHYKEGFTFQNIGEILHKPLDTVKSRHHRALKKLRTYFEEWRDTP